MALDYKICSGLRLLDAAYRSKMLMYEKDFYLLGVYWWITNKRLESLRRRNEYSYKPTVRGIFYRLVSDEVISNTFKEYKGLIQALGTARKKKSYEKGHISPVAFADDIRIMSIV